MKKSLMALLVLLGIIIAIPSLTTSIAIIKGFIQEPTVKNFQLGGAIKNSTKANLIGSASNAVDLARSWVEANATTTDAALADGGQTLTQFIDFRGAEKLRLSGLAKAGTATSTAYLTFQGSNDGDNWFNIINATTTNTVATTTLGVLRTAYEFDFGVTSSTFSYLFEMPVVDFLRVMWYSEDASTDPNDGVQMWLEAVKQLSL